MPIQSCLDNWIKINMSQGFTVKTEEQQDELPGVELQWRKGPLRLFVGRSSDVTCQHRKLTI